MPARLDPFLDVMLRERADQLYLLPDEPVTLVKDGKPRKVSKQPLTDQHIYAMMVEVAPPEAADKIDQQSETEFDYAGANGLVRVRIVPEGGRLTAVISAVRRASQEGGAIPVVQSPRPETTGKSANAYVHLDRSGRSRDKPGNGDITVEVGRGSPPLPGLRGRRETRAAGREGRREMWITPPAAPTRSSSADSAMRWPCRTPSCAGRASRGSGRRGRAAPRPPRCRASAGARRGNRTPP